MLAKIILGTELPARQLERALKGSPVFEHPSSAGKYRALQGWDLRGLLAQVLLFPLLPQPVTQTETAGCHYTTGFGGFAA